MAKEEDALLAEKLKEMKKEQTTMKRVTNLFLLLPKESRDRIINYLVNRFIPVETPKDQS